jgi:hypothetical protein
VGEVESTLLPLPVETVTPVPPLATARVPVTPEVSGKPTQLVSVPDDGVPKAGVTKTGEVESTLFPVPVEVDVPVPPLAAGRVPVTPVERGKPAQLVSVPEVGVPNRGVTSVGETESTLLPVPVEVDVPVPPFAAGRVPVTPVERGKPVQLVRVPDDGVPKKGATSVGAFERTLLPVPVEVETPVPPLATKIVPERSVVGTNALAVITVVPFAFT